MLFNSVEFMFGFFPVTALVFFGIARRSHPAAAAWLALASLFFYGWWNWAYVPLLVASATSTMSAAFILRDSCARSRPVRLPALPAPRRSPFAASRRAGPRFAGRVPPGARAG